MKRTSIITLLLFVAAFCFGQTQTNGNFTNLDVRNRSTFRGPHYIYDSTYFKPYSVNVPLLATGQPLGWFLTTTKGTEAKLVRVTIKNLADSLGPFMPQYWTYVDAATDTLYNNTPPEDSAGVIFLKHDVLTDRWLKTETNTFFGRGIVGKGDLTHSTGYEGWLNSLYGFRSGYSLSSGYNNDGFGHYSLHNTTTGVNNVGVGNFAIYYNKTGQGNTGIGNDVMRGTNTVTNYITYNTAAGHSALGDIGDGSDRNVAIGAYSLGKNVGNDNSVAVGYMAMYYADSRSSGRTTYNTAVGYEAMKGSSTAADNTGQYNTAVGYQALDAMTSGEKNSVYGVDAGGGITTGSGNVLIGYSSGSALTTESNKLYIENSNSATPLIYGDFATDSLVINGDLTVTGNILYTDTHWDDLTTAAEAAKLGVNNKPVFNYDSLALKWDDADSTTNYIVANFQMKHTYAPGTDIYPHIHYIQSSTADTVEWFIMDYKWVDVGEARPGAFTRIHTNDQTVFPYTSGSIHQIAEFPAIDGTGHTESSILECRIYCWADEEIYTKELDIHFQINKPGTYNEYP